MSGLGRALIVVAMVMHLGADADQNYECGTATQQGWREFIDRAHGFCFSYPPEYQRGARAPTSGLPPHSEALARFVSTVPRRAYAADTENASIEVWCLHRVFNLEELTKYAPTGVTAPPDPVHFGTNTFYYYGAGGGGVAYPDRYYFNLRGRALEILFDGPYNGKQKSPAPETQAIEKAILSSFRAKR